MTWHLITCEYAPQLGGVADFTRAIALGLCGRGKDVHVWSPAPAEPLGAEAVHALPGGYRFRCLAQLDAALEAFAAPRRLFVQWVPHGYGYKSLNLPFCSWVRRRARQGDAVELMVHEPYLAFDRRRLRQNGAAALHRLMLALLAGVAERVWVSTPAFAPSVARYARRVRTAGWLPVPSPIEPVRNPPELARRRYQLAGDAPLVGHFGTGRSLTEGELVRTMLVVHRAMPHVRFAILGRGTDALLRRTMGRYPALGRAVAASGPRDATELSLLLQACDVFVQPYEDGVSARRTTMTALLSHGSATVTNDGSRTESLWTRSDAVCLAAPGDAEGMAERAIRLLAAHEERRALGERARALYASHFDVRHALDALLSAGQARPDLDACA